MLKDVFTRQPLAIFGGTFDPVHYGHLRCADDARRQLGLKTLYLLPSGSPPHRVTPVATSQQRLEMLKLAVPGYPGLEIDERELHRDGPSYMVDTLQSLRSEFPDRPLLMLIGQDVANHLHRWHRWQDLFGLTHIVIMTRPGGRAEYDVKMAAQVQRRSKPDLQELSRSNAGTVVALEVPAIDISATTVKRLIDQQRSTKTFLPLAVREYIQTHHLYGAAD